MYANLKVTTPAGKQMAAWKVVVNGPYTEVYLDREDVNGNYAEPQGMLRVRGQVTVEACW